MTLLATARLELRPLAEEHLELLVALDADPAVMRFLTGRAGTREEVLARWVPRVGGGWWAAFSADAFVGWFGLNPATKPAYDEGDLELGYRLGRDAWGRGLATEGARAVVRHGFATTEAPRIAADTMAVNAASRRVLEKVGMRHVLTWHQHWDEPLPGAEHGEVLYALARAQG